MTYVIAVWRMCEKRFDWNFSWPLRIWCIYLTDTPRWGGIDYINVFGKAKNKGIDSASTLQWIDIMEVQPQSTLHTTPQAYEILLLIHKGAGEIIEGLPTFVQAMNIHWSSLKIQHPKRRSRIHVSSPKKMWMENNTPWWRKMNTWIPAYFINTPLQPLHDIPNSHHK